MERRVTLGLLTGIGFIAGGIGLSCPGRLHPGRLPVTALNVTTASADHIADSPAALALPNGSPIGCPSARPLAGRVTPRSGLPVNRVARLRVVGSCD
jgi:hypothetical protein